MVPYSRSTDSTLSYKGRGFGGNETSSSTTVPSTLVNFTCENGTLRGDHRKPTNNALWKDVRVGKAYRDYSRTVDASNPANVQWGFDLSTAPSRLFGPEATPFSGYGLNLTPDWNALYDRTLEKQFDKIRGNSNFAVDLAESGATIRMFRDTLNLRNLLKDFWQHMVVPKRLRGADNLQRRLDYVTGKWLEYRYGWQPLVNSIYDACDELGKQFKSGVIPVRSRVVLQNAKVTRTGSGSYTDPVIIKDIQGTYRYEMVFYINIDPGVHLYDWTSLNPLGIAWELLPLSFVGDWIVNVSQQLSLWENYFLFASKFNSGYRTSSAKEITSYTVYGDSYNPQQSGAIVMVAREKEYGYTRTLTYKNRVALTSLPMPSGIRLNVNIGAKRQLDAAALVHQLIGKKFR